MVDYSSLTVQQLSRKVLGIVLFSKSKVLHLFGFNQRRRINCAKEELSAGDRGHFDRTVDGEKSRMELLILLLLTPSLIPAHRYRSVSPSSSGSNDEPFLPIYPVYPYSPKLMKRGTERDLVAPLTAELYAPKLDARDSYTTSFGGHYPRDPYYPSYNPYPKTSGSNTYPISNPVSSAGFTPTGSYSSSSTSFASPSVFSTPNAAYASQNAAGFSGTSYSPYSAGYSNPYRYSPTPYGIYNSYSAPYTQPPGPYTPSPYPNYNYQAPYFYPNYYNQPYPALPPPPPPHPAQEYPESSSSDDADEVDGSGKSNVGTKKSENKKNRSKDKDSENNKESQDGQFVDGGNFLSSSIKDLDGQSTSYKAPGPYNQLTQLSDVHLRSVPIAGLPRTTYRVISVGGQPVGPDYPLPQTYAKVQQLEQIMSQTLAKLLAQNNANQAGQYQTHEQSDNSGLISNGNLVNQSPQSVIARTGLAYVVDPANLAKSPSGQGQFVSNYNRQNPVVIKGQDSNHGLQQSSTILSKASAKYADGHFPHQKSITTVSLQQAPGIYIPPEAKNIKDDNSQPTEYNDYDSTSGQNYDNSNSGYKKNEQNYSIDQAGQGAPYHNSNLVTVQTPQPQNYQYPSFLSTQSNQQQQPRDYKTGLDDVNFSTKRNTKE